MRSTILRWAAVAWLASAPLAVVMAAAAPYDVAATEAWRQKYEQDLKAPEGWLTVAGLFFLKPGGNSVGADPASEVVLPAGSAPADVGRLTHEAARVWLDLASGVSATLNDQPINGRVELRPANSAEKRPADRVIAGRAIFFVHRSGERLAIRVRDPESTILRSFTGVRWYPIDPAWQVEGTFVPFATPRKVQIQNILGDVEAMTSPGEVTATVKGKPVRLLAVTARGGLWFIISDETAGRETYRLRFLYTPLPVGDKLALDFNRVENPPCAYNPYTTCPLPPSQNKLPVALTAGEKSYTPTTGSDAKR